MAVRPIAVLGLLTAVPPLLVAQVIPPLDQLATRLAGMTAVSGYERAMGDTLLTLLPGATRDRMGNIVLTVGAGEPRILVACPIDEPGFVVGGIRPDGYLTLRRVGPNPGPLADQQLEGQRVIVFGRSGPIPGVVGVRSVHLTRGRTMGDAPFTFDDAYLDVGADSAAQVARLGIEVLSPVGRAKEPMQYGDTLLAAPVAGRRVAMAALLRAARAARATRGTVMVAFVVEQSFTRRGLLSIVRTKGPFVETLLIDPSAAAGSPGGNAAPDPELPSKPELWGLGLRYPGTPVETVSLREAERLELKLRARLGGGE